MAKLYIVPTPIGNLDDITLRAVNVLRDVDFILAEDTRTTSFLLKHLGIEKKLYSHHKFNEHATVKMVAEVLEHFRTTDPKGEFVIVLAGKPKPKRETAADEEE